MSAGVVKLVDTSDSKSDASDSVPVQVRPPVPNIILKEIILFGYHVYGIFVYSRLECAAFLIHKVYYRGHLIKDSNPLILIYTGR